MDTVVARVRSESARIGRDALVVAAFDTELFGHWWYEGPIWLERVLRALPEAGVRVGTLRSAAEAGYVGAAREIPASSWGSGKDWHVWDGPQVREFVDLNDEITTTVLRVLDKRRGRVRDVVSDQVLQEGLMCLQSDWPFMVSKDTAAGYARDRAYKHAHALREIAEAAERGDEGRAVALARAWKRADDPFPGSTHGASPRRWEATDMRVLLVSWEYPPVVVGGLGRHVHHLALQLRDQGHEVVVLSRQPTGTDPRTHPTTDASVDGIRVIMAAEDPLALDFGTDMMPWVLSMGHSMLRAGLRLAGFNPTAGEDALHGAGSVGRPWVPDVVHAHDWLAAHAAVGLAEAFDAPLVATVHATEAGRHSGWVSGPVNRQVHSTEMWLANEADAVITCSRSMSDEVNRLFGPGLAQLHVIANGIDSSLWPFRDRSAAVRSGARRGAPACCTSAGWSTRRGCRTWSPRWPGCAARTPGPR
ncbi:hypothetical protein MTP03_34200 [Tsukamurella sp. PLM1]|nr:hypothetical protein MTP03_34200 [Tsukamurella sp. PLM1]